MPKHAYAKWLIPLAAIAALALLVGAWSRFSSGEAAATNLATAKVIRRDFSASVMATGAVKPRIGAEVRVGARISGKVERLHANIGDAVKKGQVIAELEKADLVATVAQRQAEVVMAEARLSAVETLRPKEIEKAESDVAQWQATVGLTKKELDRQEALLKQKVAPQSTLDEAQERNSVAQAQRNSAQKTLDLARARLPEERKQAVADIQRVRAALANAEAQVAFATLSAPIDGVIASVSTQAGETVSAGLNAPTFVTIIDLRRLQVDAFVDEVDIGKIKPGQEAAFTVDAFPAREFKGKVEAIYPKAILQDNVVNYDVVVRIDDGGDGLLRPDMTASVSILLEARQNVLAIPAQAVKRERGKSVVRVQAGSEAQSREIKTGWRDGQWIEVVSGLEEGQVVLLEPAPQKAKEP